MAIHQQKITYVLNWKLERSYTETITWCTTHAHDLAVVAQHAHIIFCPEATTLASVAHILPSSIALGAQHCSPFMQGRHTGSISAHSLAEIGCRFCIVGHYETRRDMCLDNDMVTQIVKNLLLLGITPIICFGEQEQCASLEEIYAILTEQLTPLKTLLHSLQPPQHPVDLFIAYEPIWAIGTNTTPPLAWRHAIGNWLTIWKQQFHHYRIDILYGGGITPESLHHNGTGSPYKGYLLGKASLDMQTLKKLIH